MSAKRKDEKEPHFVNKKEVISLGVGRPPIAKCTCGWKSEPTEDLYDLGVAAFAHRDETGHELRKPETALA